MFLKLLYKMNTMAFVRRNVIDTYGQRCRQQAKLSTSVLLKWHGRQMKMHLMNILQQLGLARHPAVPHAPLKWYVSVIHSISTSISISISSCTSRLRTILQYHHQYKTTCSIINKFGTVSSSPVVEPLIVCPITEN